MFNKTRKRQEQRKTARNRKLKMLRLSEEERDFVLLVLDGGRTESRLRRRGLNAELLAREVTTKGFTVIITNDLDPIYNIKEY